jgi:hypothetical protein
MKFIEKLKGAVRSRTIWFNAVLGALWATIGQWVPYLADALPQLAPYLGEDKYRTLMLVVTAGNIVLRFKTSTSLGEKKP